MNTKNAYTSIKNGWLFSAQEAINKVYDELRSMIKNRKVSSRIQIFHANEVKSFIENTHQELIEIKILRNNVCGVIEIRLNIDFDELSESEIYELKNSTKNFKNKKFGFF